MPHFSDNERFRKLLLSYPAKAIQFLYEYYYDDLIRISSRFTHDRKISEDILQETFLHVWKKHELLGQPNDKPILPYLIRIVQNKSISFYKKEARALTARLTYNLETRADRLEASVEDRVISEEIHVYLKSLIAEFPRRERECYFFSREEDMSTKEIAKRLKISVKAVERSITSAKKRLKTHWKLLNLKGR